MRAHVERARRHALDVLGAAAAIVFALPSITYPFGIDQPIHYYIGRQLLEGEMPYAESGISTKPPGAFVVHSIAIALFGDHAWSIRVVDLGFVIACGVLIATFRARRCDPTGRALPVPARRPGEIGAACLICAFLYYGLFDFSDTAHPELWQATFMLAAGWVIVRAPDGRVSVRRAFLCGALACIAVTFKHVAAFTGVLCGLAIVILWLSKRAPLMALKSAGAFTGGVALVLFLTVAPFWLTGTFDAFWELMVEFILDYAGEAGAGGEAQWPRWLTVKYALPAVAVCLAALVMGLGIAAAGRDRRGRLVGYWILLSMLVAFGTIAIQKRVFFGWGFTYHWIVLVPFLGLALAWGLRQRFGRRGGAQMVAAVLLAALVLLQAPRWTHQPQHDFRAEWISWWDYVNGRRDAEAYHAVHDNGERESYGRIVQIAQVLNARKRPGDTLCVDGFLAHLYEMTKMRCPSRFIIGDGVLDVPEWHAEYRRMLDENPPTFFVTFQGRPRIRQLTERGYDATVMNLRPTTYVLLDGSDR